jgi:hypothetical protein
LRANRDGSAAGMAHSSDDGWNVGEIRKNIVVLQVRWNSGVFPANISIVSVKREL